MYHLTVKIKSRSNNQHVLSASAYISGQRLYDERHKLHFDFTSKKGIAYSEIILPSHAPPQFANREVLWNAVELVENRKDSRLAREVEFALPRELNLAEQIELSRTFVIENFVSLGMCADLCIHHKNDENPHAHVLLTDRPVDSNGFLEKKDPSWNRRELVKAWRKTWEIMLNREYERKGLDKRVSCESYKTQRIVDRKPTKHLGPRVLKYADQGQMTDRFLDHLKILRSDREREKLMVNALRKAKNPRDREKLIAIFLEIVATEPERERLMVRFSEIQEHSHEQWRERGRSFERSR